jgi:hypothetical protein
MDWQTLRNQFMRTIGGDPPGAALEDQLIQAYTEHPQAVERSVEKITLAYAAGKIRSPWGALKAEVAKATEAARNPTHDRGASKSKAVARAEQRIRNELLHYDRWPEVEAELFGERGTLKEHATDDVRDRMETLWRDLRPLGEIVEHEADERGRRYQEQRARLQPEKREPAETNVSELIRQEIAEAKAKAGTPV